MHRLGPAPCPLCHRSLDELIGRADLLAQRAAPMAKTSGLDLSFLTTYAGPSGSSSSRRLQAVHENGQVLDDEILEDKEVMDAIINEKVGVRRAADVLR